jgi:hypothetical protein
VSWQSLLSSMPLLYVLGYLCVNVDRKISGMWTIV